MNTCEIVFLDRATLPEFPFNFDFPHHITNYSHSSPDQVAARIAQANIVVSNKVRINADAINNSPQLQLIAVPATGLDHIDQQAAQQRNIDIRNVRGYGNDTVAEHTMMLILALMRQLPAYQRDVAAGLWQNSPFFCHFGAPIRDLNGKTLGIFGKGGIGQALAERAQAFGMRILWGEHKHATSCRHGYTPFTQLIQEADVISLHCPLNEQTRNLIDEAELKMMKPQAVLINVGRGGLVAEQALIAALKYGRLGGAGVDVLSEEPPVHGNPLLRAQLPNLIITPHMAWGSEEAIQRICTILENNINAFMHKK
ncbi:D-2-hydroxyacid dehydrogenase [Snodgrassella communis]|uniref:D-2-hydroxyacid dehydrogenase n=1 Tax=Snodgrassella communis TaxID=2946699 RepID=UPI001EF4E087|nr:D-2-hydroxyacid dehydrogenase [Snodgrassella communis]WMY92014.1 D-2-hydroxyacid dehydrogenase [Snodgrassella communis]